MPGWLVSAQPTTTGPSQGQTLDSWDRQAERTFGLGPGQGRLLMTQKEWEQHRQGMQGMTEQERERYRAEMHARLSERATPRGPSAPASPGMQGFGSEAGGMGPGGGMSGVAAWAAAVAWAVAGAAWMGVARGRRRFRSSPRRALPRSLPDKLSVTEPPGESP